MTTIINLTPHEITLIISEDEKMIFPPSGIIARCEEIVARIEPISIEYEFEGFDTPTKILIPLVDKSFGKVQNIPEPTEENKDTYYIVSMLCAQNSGRNHLLTVGDTIRNSKGQIIGCKNFILD